MQSPFLEVLAALARAFDRLGASWYLFGAQAAIVHGAGRLTTDVDVTVFAQGSDTSSLADELAAEGFELRVQDPEFVARTRVLPVRHGSTEIDADVVLGGPGLEELFLQRSEEHTIAGVHIPVACAEDVVAMKVLAGRPLDLEDAQAVVEARAGDLDEALVRDTLRVLEQALDRSDLLRTLDALWANVRRGT